METEQLFNKRYEFVTPQPESNQWIPPPPEKNKCGLVDENEALKDMKSELNKLKMMLNDYDIAKWNKHTLIANPASYINSYIKKYGHPELCTQAWCKFYEILCFNEVIPHQALSSKVVNAVHICEAPGAFICSLNHFLKSRYGKIKYQWVSCTLNPYYEGHHPDSCIGDDRLIFQTLHNWCFGPDNTGDIFSRSTLDDLRKRTSEWGRIDLVTADGSVNCQDNPENQELDTATLKYTELIYALNLLSPGGSFVLKMFTVFEDVSVILLYLVCCTFSSVCVCKPATSKPGNSEVYVTARGFCGKDYCKELLDILMKRFPFRDVSNLDIFSHSAIPTDYIIQHQACVTKFVKLQMEAIKQNMKLYPMESFCAEFDETKKKIAEHAVDLLQIHRIQRNQCILRNRSLSRSIKSNIKLRPRLQGSFTERKCTSALGLDGEVKSSDHQDREHGTGWLYPPENSLSLEDVSFVFGKVLSTIMTSLFCDTDKIMRLHKVWAICDGTDSDLPCYATSGVRNLFSQLLTSGSIEAYELDTGLSSICWTQILYDAFGKHLCKMQSLDLKVMQGVTKDAVVFANLVTMDNSRGRFRELMSLKQLISASSYIMKCLQTGASVVFLLPSVLTRLSAGVIWLLCQSFECYMMFASGGSSIPGLFIFCRNFQESGRYGKLLDMAEKSFAEYDQNKALLEIVPIKILLHDKSFSSSLMSCNHQILSLRLLGKHEFIL